MFTAVCLFLLELFSYSASIPAITDSCVTRWTTYGHTTGHIWTDNQVPRWHPTHNASWIKLCYQIEQVWWLPMTFLFQLEGFDDLVKIGFLRPLYLWRHFRWRLSAIRASLLHCCLSCRYYTYQTPHSVLGSMLHGSETTAKNLGQHLPRLLRTIHCFINYKTFMENIHGDSLPEN